MNLRVSLTVLGKTWTLEVKDVRTNQPDGTTLQWKKIDVYFPSGSWAASISVPDSCDPEALKDLLTAVASSVQVAKADAVPGVLAMN